MLRGTETRDLGLGGPSLLTPTRHMCLFWFPVTRHKKQGSSWFPDGSDVGALGWVPCVLAQLGMCLCYSGSCSRVPAIAQNDRGLLVDLGLPDDASGPQRTIIINNYNEYE
jgi:hypothetical protein